MMDDRSLLATDGTVQGDATTAITAAATTTATTTTVDPNASRKRNEPDHNEIVDTNMIPRTTTGHSTTGATTATATATATRDDMVISAGDSMDGTDESFLQQTQPRSSKRRTTTSLVVSGSSAPSTTVTTSTAHNAKNTTSSANIAKANVGVGRTKNTGNSSTGNCQNINNHHQEQMQLYIQNLPPLQKSIPVIKKLTKLELEELEFILEFHHNFSYPNSNNTANDHGVNGNSANNSNNNNSARSRNNSPTETVSYDKWKEDWTGNLSMVDKDIVNPALHRAFIQQNRSSLLTSLKTLPNYPKKVLQQRQSLLDWARNTDGPPSAQQTAIRYIRLILQHVCTFSSATIPPPTQQQQQQPVIPSAIKKIFGTITEQTSIDDIVFRIRRVSYDPQVLQEDGWTIQKSEQPIGASGGPYLIGDTILSDNAVAIIIAYIYDADIGDLWKALYIDDEFISFDLEAEELVAARNKYNKKYGITAANIPTPLSGNNNEVNATNGSRGITATDETTTASGLAAAAASTSTTTQMKRPTRSTIANDFTVKGIEYGIVLAASYSKGARFNVYWPARVVHASESYGINPTTTSTNTTATNTTMNASTGSKRNSSRQKVDVIFLAPYWTSDDLFGASRQRRITESLSLSDDVGSKTNPLLMIETVDANDEMIKEFPMSANGGLDVGQLRISFRFTGLPKSVFSRYLDAHRMALGLQLYAKNHVKPLSLSHQDRAAAGLFEAHPMSVQVPTFPNVVLHLPFRFILSNLPRSYSNIDDCTSGTVEPILNLETIVNAMKPPYCWKTSNDDSTNSGTFGGSSNDKQGAQIVLPMPSDLAESAIWMNGDDKNEADEDRAAIANFMTEFPLLNDSFNRFYNSAPLVAVLSTLIRLLSQLGEAEEEMNVASIHINDRKMKLQSFVASWSILKKLGEESLASLPVINASNCTSVIQEWRQAAEKIYHFMIAMFADGKEIGHGLSAVLTDTNCNGHITSSGSLERQVRLPAAVKGAKLAGAGCGDTTTRLITTIPAHYLEYVTEKLLPKAHDVLYLKRMKSRCKAAQTDEEVLVLTDDSEGEGGEDTGTLFSLELIAALSF